MEEAHHHSGERRQRTRTHGYVETLVCLGDSLIRRDAEVCACGAQRLVSQAGKPAGIWSQMKPVPYANPVGHIDQLTQDGFSFTISQPGGLRRPDRRRPGGGAAPLRGDRRHRQGAGNRDRRGPGRGQRFAVTGPWANQEDLLREGAPVHLEPAD